MVGKCSVRVVDRIVKFDGGCKVNDVETKIRAIFELHSGGLLEGDAALMSEDMLETGKLYDFKGGLPIGTGYTFISVRGYCGADGEEYHIHITSSTLT